MKKVLSLIAVLSIPVLMIAYTNLTPPPPEVLGYGLGSTNNASMWISTQYAPCPVTVNFKNLDWQPIGKITTTYCREGNVSFLIPSEIRDNYSSVRFDVQLQTNSNLWSKNYTLNIRPPLYTDNNLGVGYNLPDLAMNYLINSTSPDANAIRKKMGKRSIRSAYRSGAQHVAVFLPGYFPRNSLDLDSDRNNLALWQTNPSAYWAKLDEMFNDVSSYGLGIIVRGWNDLLVFPALVGEGTRDLITNPSSNSYKLYAKYWTQFATRYGDRPELLALGAPNEMNSWADLDMKKRCLDAGGTQTSCATSTNFTTSEMNVFSKRIVAMFKAAAPKIKVVSGMSLQRTSAYHLQQSPEWQGADWTLDSEAEFEEYFAALQAPYDYADVHTYNQGDGLNLQRFGYGVGDPTSAAFISYLAEVAQKIGKPLYLGEFADAFPGGIQREVLAQNILKQIGVPNFFSASLWSMDFYQRNNYELQGISGEIAPIDGANTKLLPVYSLMATKRNALNGRAIYKKSYTAPYRITNAFISFPLTGTSVPKSTIVNVLADGGSAAIEKIDISLDGKIIRTLTAWPYKTTLYRSQGTAGTHALKITAYGVNGTTDTDSITVVFP